jgi:hypothetical protein
LSPIILVKPPILRIFSKFNRFKAFSFTQPPENHGRIDEKDNFLATTVRVDSPNRGANMRRLGKKPANRTSLIRWSGKLILASRQIPSPILLAFYRKKAWGTWLRELKGEVKFRLGGRQWI